MKTKVFAKLKPKAASLGFSREELEGVAADIATNLNSEDATDEDIDAQIDAALPLLRVAQKAANRAIEDARKKATTNWNFKLNSHSWLSRKIIETCKFIYRHIIQHLVTPDPIVKDLYKFRTQRTELILSL